MTRLAPLEPPFGPDLQRTLDRMMGGTGAEPLALFRTVAHNAQILDKFLNIMPTVAIREGHRVKIYLSGDLALPDYNNHKLPSDL